MNDKNKHRYSTESKIHIEIGQRLEKEELLAEACKEYEAADTLLKSLGDDSYHGLYSTRAADLYILQNKPDYSKAIALYRFELDYLLLIGARTKADELFIKISLANFTNNWMSKFSKDLDEYSEADSKIKNRSSLRFILEVKKCIESGKHKELLSIASQSSYENVDKVMMRMLKVISNR